MTAYITLLLRFLLLLHVVLLLEITPCLGSFLHVVGSYLRSRRSDIFHELADTQVLPQVSHSRTSVADLLLDALNAGSNSFEICIERLNGAFRFCDAIIALIQLLLRLLLGLSISSMNNSPETAGTARTAQQLY